MRPLLLLASAAIQAQTGAKWTWGAEADFNRIYLWRGAAYSNGAVFQPAFWARRSGFYALAWSNMGLTQADGRGRFDQIYAYAGFPHESRDWSIEPGLQGYYWKSNTGGFNAASIGALVRVARRAGPVWIFTNQTLDVGAYRGSYFADAGVNWTRSHSRFEWDASVRAGWANARFNEGNLGVAAATLNHVETDLAVTIRLGRGLFVRPHTESVVLVGPALRRGLSRHSFLNLGMAFGVEF